MSQKRPPFSIRRRIEFIRMCNSLFEEWLTDDLGIPFAEEFFTHDRMYPVVHTDADFRKALRMGDELEITLVLTRLGRSSIHYACIGRTGGEEAFRINIVNSIGRRSAGRSIEIPPPMRARMEAYLERCAGAAG